MSSLDTTALRNRRSFPKGWVPFVVGLFVLWNVFVLSSHNIQITPRLENGSGAIWLAVCFALIGSMLGYVAARNDTTNLPKSLIAFSASAAVGAVMLYGPATAAIRGIIDFPPSTTKEYQTLIPIISAEHHESGRSDSSWVRLSSYNVNVMIVSQDYRFMQQTLSNFTDVLPSNGFFCADVRAQQAGDAVRIIHTTLGTLPPHSVVVCPTRASNG